MEHWNNVLLLRVCKTFSLFLSSRSIDIWHTRYESMSEIFSFVSYDFLSSFGFRRGKTDIATFSATFRKCCSAKDRLKAIICRCATWRVLHVRKNFPIRVNTLPTDSRLIGFLSPTIFLVIWAVFCYLVLRYLARLRLLRCFVSSHSFIPIWKTYRSRWTKRMVFESLIRNRAGTRENLSCRSDVRMLLNR